jgi:mannosyltransferase OCH1-like enzyme
MSLNNDDDYEHFLLSNYQKTYIPEKQNIVDYINTMTWPVKQYEQERKPDELLNSEIPKDIYMVWHSSELPPIMKTYIDEEIANNPEFNFFIYNLETCREFIKQNFNEDVLRAFDTLGPMAYKADLWRCCILYIKGGIYLDIKYIPVNGFKFIDIIDKERFTLERDGYFWENGTFGINNALIVAKAGNQILSDCIDNIVDNVNNKFYGFNDLYPTGPGLMGQIYFEYKQRYDDIDLFFVGYPEGKYTIQLGKSIILQSYPEYNAERTAGGKHSYASFYGDKNIYNEKQLNI